MSRFDVVRAKWETQYPRRGDSSLTIPLLRADTSQTPSMASKQMNTQPPSNRRITTGLGMLNRPINNIRNKAFNRSRESSSGTQDEAHREVPFARRFLSEQVTVHKAKENTRLIKSQTTSFLPVPSKSSARLAPILSKSTSSKSRTTSYVDKSRLPTPPKPRRPSFLPRSTTHPHLGTFVVGRRASEFPRRQSVRWPFLDEEDEPLLRTPVLHTPTIEEDNFRTNPRTFLAQTDDQHVQESPKQRSAPWGALNTPPKSQTDEAKAKSTLQTGHCNSGASPPIRSARVIQCHKLLQPIQPVSPPTGTIPGIVPDASTSVPLIPAKKPIGDSRPVFINRKDLQRPTPLSLSPSRSQNTITKAQPNTYWSGRFTTIQDRIMNETFDIDSRPMSSDEVESSSGSTVSLVRHNQNPVPQESSEAKRAERIFQILDESCATDEARRSLLIFRNMYAIRLKMPFLRCQIPPPPPEMAKLMEQANTETVDNVGAGVGGGLTAGLRKISFMNRLRGRKSSGKSVASGLRESN